MAISFTYGNLRDTLLLKVHLQALAGLRFVHLTANIHSGKVLDIRKGVRSLKTSLSDWTTNKLPKKGGPHMSYFAKD